jgi:hypothetical protein
MPLSSPFTEHLYRYTSINICDISFLGLQRLIQTEIAFDIACRTNSPSLNLGEPTVPYVWQGIHKFLMNLWWTSTWTQLDSTWKMDTKLCAPFLVYVFPVTSFKCRFRFLPNRIYNTLLFSNYIQQIEIKKDTDDVTQEFDFLLFKFTIGKFDVVIVSLN